MFSLQSPLVRKPLEPPGSGLLPQVTRGRRPRHSLVPTPGGRLILRGPLCISLTPQRVSGVHPSRGLRNLASSLCVGNWLRRAREASSEGPAPGHLGAARAPHSPARSGAAGVLPGRAVGHQNPDPSYPPRESLRPADDSPSSDGFQEPNAATTSFAASENGRQAEPRLRVPVGGGPEWRTSRGGAAQARCGCRESSRKSPGFGVRGIRDGAGDARC